MSGGGEQGGASWERTYHRPLLLGGGLSALTRASICLGDWSLRSVSHACVMEPQEELCPDRVKAEFNLDPFSAVN